MAEQTESVNAAPLPLDIGIFAHNEAASIAGLDGNEGLTQHLLGEFTGLFGRFDKVNTTLEAILEVTLASTTGVHLGLDDQLRAFEFLGRCNGLFRGGGDFTLGAGDAVLIKELLGLVLVDIHD